MHCGGGLLVGGVCGEERLDTPEGWRCRIDAGRMPREWKEAWSAIHMTPIAPMDRVDFNFYDPGWVLPEYDDSDWDAPVAIGSACLAGSTRDDPATPWLMTPRAIGGLTGTFTAIARIHLGVGAELELRDGRLQGTVPAGLHKVILDIGRNQTSLVHMTGQGGKGTCRIAYAETLFKDGKRSDRVRPDGEIGESGYADELVMAGAAWRYDSFWYRSGRFVELTFTLSEPVKLKDFSLEFFAYDFQLKAAFQSPRLPGLEAIWNTAWHTARCCAHEHYEDCPYYEQLQYAGDTRVQALISYAAAGDGRLGRQAIRHFDWSRLPSGITQSRYPNVFTQVIPEFSLIWVLMIDDYYRYFGDRKVIVEHRLGLENVLDYFESLREPCGLIGDVGHWNFTDWAGWPNGKSNRNTGEAETVVNLFYAEACRVAARLLREINQLDSAAVYDRRREQTLSAANRYCFDRERGLYRDVPSQPWFSCHANALAILSDAAAPERQWQIGCALADDPTLTQCTLYFNFYVLEALRKCRNGDGFMKKLAPWRQMLELGFTTFPECPSPDLRSECHAWSSSPVYEFVTGLLGVNPALPGFAEIEVAPLGPDNLTFHGRAPLGNCGLLAIVAEPEQITLEADRFVRIQLKHPTGETERLSLNPNQKIVCPIKLNEQVQVGKTNRTNGY